MKDTKDRVYTVYELWNRKTGKVLVGRYRQRITENWMYSKTIIRKDIMDELNNGADIKDYELIVIKENFTAPEAYELVIEIRNKYTHEGINLYGGTPYFDKAQRSPYTVKEHIQERSIETSLRMSRVRKGVKKSLETREKMKKNSNHGYSKKVFFDGKIYDSVRQLSKESGVKYTTLCAYLSGANRMPTYFSEKGLRLL